MPAVRNDEACRQSTPGSRPTAEPVACGRVAGKYRSDVGTRAAPNHDECFSPSNPDGAGDAGGRVRVGPAGRRVDACDRGARSGDGAAKVADHAARLLPGVLGMARIDGCRRGRVVVGDRSWPQPARQPRPAALVDREAHWGDAPDHRRAHRGSGHCGVRRRSAGDVVPSCQRRRFRTERLGRLDALSHGAALCVETGAAVGSVPRHRRQPSSQSLPRPGCGRQHHRTRPAVRRLPAERRPVA